LTNLASRIKVEFVFHPFTLKIKISYDFQIIPQLFHYSISIPEQKIIPKHPKME
jgi:hypothetical protein